MILSQQNDNWSPSVDYVIWQIKSILKNSRTSEGIGSRVEGEESSQTLETTCQYPRGIFEKGQVVKRGLKIIKYERWRKVKHIQNMPW